MRPNHLRRRDFISLLGGATACSLAARAQQPDRVRRIGVLIGLAESDPEGQARVGGLRQGLQELGWIDGRNVQIDYRWADNADLRRVYAAELVGLTPDVLFAAATPALVALRQATRTIPIVFAQIADPVANGFVASLAHPGGNITGFVPYENTMGAKWLELLKEIAPRVIHVTVIYDSTNPLPGYLREIQVGASLFGVQLTPAGARDAAEIERAVDALPRDECRPDCVSGSHHDDSSRRDHRSGGPPSLARGLPVPLLRHKRWPDILRNR
jgi:putative ABC transport system substrate-binding protein